MTETIDWANTLETALSVPGKMGDTYTRFYPYSFLNQILLYSQGVLEPVATYKRWQELGRRARVGHTKKAIVRPVTVRKKDRDGKDTDDTFTRFKLVKCLILVSDTDGDELPAYTPPGWSLEKATAELGITCVPFAQLNGNIQGYSFQHSYAINPVAVYPFKTTLHELAHIVLGHTTAEDNDGDGAVTELHQGIQEFQAEACAYLLMKELDSTDHFNADESRAYIQHWLGDTTVPDKAINQVFTTVQKILAAGRA